MSTSAEDTGQEHDIVALLFEAFESGWFDNKGDLGEAWIECKPELLKKAAALRSTDVQPAEPERVAACMVYDRVRPGGPYVIYVEEGCGACELEAARPTICGHFETSPNPDCAYCQFRSLQHTEER